MYPWGLESVPRLEDRGVIVELYRARLQCRTPEQVYLAKLQAVLQLAEQAKVLKMDSVEQEWVPRVDLFEMLPAGTLIKVLSRGGLGYLSVASGRRRMVVNAAHLGVDVTTITTYYESNTPNPAQLLGNFVMFDYG